MQDVYDALSKALLAGVAILGLLAITSAGVQAFGVSVGNTDPSTVRTVVLAAGAVALLGVWLWITRDRWYEYSFRTASISTATGSIRQPGSRRTHTVGGEVVRRYQQAAQVNQTEHVTTFYDRFGRIVHKVPNHQAQEVHRLSRTEVLKLKDAKKILSR